MFVHSAFFRIFVADVLTRTETKTIRKMKRILLLMLSVVVSTMMMADDVTPEEALQQATQFVQNRAARGNGPRLAPGVQPKLTLASRVSDLYVFNVSDDAGFIIVSNDDCAIPVLGYSDSGSFDANNLPDNMRAWLQGYADEIAWAKANNVKPVANAPKRAALGGNVGPLLETHWDQESPYNDLCPEYNNKRSLTGCVATAMAQVMYYTAKKAGQSFYTLTKDIPAYTTGTLGINVNGIASGSLIDWSLMQDAYGYYYDGSSWHKITTTNEQDAAVANLMKICGVTLEMDYAPEGSGAATAIVDWALINYFGYSTETTQHLDRDSYSDENWEKIIYHEISNGRPVIYGGQAYRVVSGTPDPDQCAGHAFVCDGYKYENDNSYFHINWGWGGTSDDYFALSALEPADQGYGGVDNDYTGFNYSQLAVIGIQLNGGEGTVAPEVSTVSGIALRIISIDVSENPTKVSDTPITITARLANNSSTTYSSPICLWVAEGKGWSYLDSFTGEPIASGSSQNYVFSYTPNTAGIFIFSLSYYDSSVPINMLFGPDINLAVYPAGTMNQYGWATFSSNCPLDFTNVEGIEAAYIVTGNDGITINKTAVNKVPANTGLLLKGTPNADYIIPITQDETDDVSSNKLVAVNTTTEVTAATAANTTNYVLSVQNDKVVFANIGTNSATVPAGRAYLTLTSAAAPWFSLDGDGETTGISEVRGANDEFGNVFYDLSGRRVENPTKGVYIVKGRKVVIK